MSFIESTLKNCSFFNEVTEKRQEFLIKIAIEKAYAKGQLIFSQGDSPQGLYIVGSGLVRIFKTGSQGKEHVLHFAQKGMTFAEAAVIGDFPCPAYAEAVEDSRIVIIDAFSFKKLLNEDRDFSQEILLSQAHFIRRFVDLIDGIVLQDAIARVSNYLLVQYEEQGPQIALPSLKKYLASHLNLSSESFSRVLNKLRKEGALENDSDINIKNIDILRFYSNGS